MCSASEIHRRTNGRSERAGTFLIILVFICLNKLLHRHGEFNADDMVLRRVGSTSICSSGLLAHAYQSRHQPIYAPMQINARKLLSKYGDKFFNTEHKKEAGPSDHLLIVQLCANDPSQLLTSTAAIQDLRMLSI
ncbi:hypothetical protein EDC04DRAFT_2735324 [Pisolithus marmoratus]|nr:hypothetical protein EDC04DRAFT_2735324 [Pisolithus marmoratus]